jgi:bis(5'-nucleosidyl)-tetraphosphatase
MMEERSAGAIIFRETEKDYLYLLLHYPSGHWDFVKGKIEEGEQLQQTVVRESREETGISDLKFIDDFKETIEYNFQYDGKLVHKSVIFFLAKTETSNIIISHEHLDFTWLNFDDALEKTTYENARILLKKANKLLCKGL